MPKTHEYGASYPDGAIIAHDGTVTSTPDEGNEAPRIEDESRPGGTDAAPPIDETDAGDKQDNAERAQEQKADAPDTNVKPLKRASSRNSR